MRSWRDSIRALGSVVMMVKVASGSSPLGLSLASQRPAKVVGGGPGGAKGDGVGTLGLWNRCVCHS